MKKKYITGFNKCFSVWSKTDFDFSIPEHQEILITDINNLSENNARKTLELEMLYKIISENIGMDWDAVQKIMPRNNMGQTLGEV